MVDGCRLGEELGNSKKDSKPKHFGSKPESIFCFVTKILKSIFQNEILSALKHLSSILKFIKGDDCEFRY